MKFLLLIFGCRHDWSWPIRRKLPGGFKTQPYQTCLKCGTQRWYDWDRMQPGEEIKPKGYFRLAVSE